MSHDAISSLLKEDRRFEPAAEFSLVARIGSREKYDELYRESVESPDTFWARETEDLVFHSRWERPSSGSCRTPSGSWAPSST